MPIAWNMAPTGTNQGGAPARPPAMRRPPPCRSNQGAETESLQFDPSILETDDWDPTGIL